MSSTQTLFPLDLFRGEDVFSAADYVAFSFLMLVSSAIGVYYAFMGVHKSHEEFVLGGRSLHGAPVAMSLTASFMSAIAVLGTPAEVYRFGMEFALFAISHTLMVVLTAHVYGPVYHRQHITTAYEYLELRFNNKYLRMTGTIMFIVQTISYSGIVIYVPSLALNQVTGFALWGAIVGTGIICTFYCTMLIPYLVLKLWKDVPGVPGLFVAGTYSGSLRLLSLFLEYLVDLFWESLVWESFCLQPILKLSYIQLDCTHYSSKTSSVSKDLDEVLGSGPS